MTAVNALELRDLRAGYDKATVLWDLTLDVPTGSIAALLGPNGAGKTTLMRTIAGLLRPSAGSVTLAGTDVTRASPHKRAQHGLCMVPEGRGIFRNLSVQENLRIQAPPWVPEADAVEKAIKAFPVLGRRGRQAAGSLSGGEQQMLAMARAFMADWKVVLLDEVSIGLAPRIVDEIYDAVRGLAGSDVALLIVEQYVGRVLGLADVVFLLDHGAATYSGPASGVDEERLTAGYFGESPAGVP
ncbi:ABC transporter ATP-binding protein [Amycolatopsis sp. GM8]|uniref:ABC transporter ATP-binding protein n=1 Tax=Amycolatopsis sp. GM8 TaxID=2896530 RepID=UPI001F45F3F0|nr:ABC transporter ATP-binding protein [Amycolatopsis sp. GM8]